jgi:hypothetical protein
MSGKLPAGDGNGLSAIVSQLVRDDKQMFVTIALIDCKKVVLDKDTGEKIPEARVRRIEVVLDDGDKKVLQRLMERALAKRTGHEQLPYDLQAEMEEVFETLDLGDLQQQAEQNPDSDEH